MTALSRLLLDSRRTRIDRGATDDDGEAQRLPQRLDEGEVGIGLRPAQTVVNMEDGGGFGGEAVRERDGIGSAGDGEDDLPPLGLAGRQLESPRARASR